MAKVLLKVPPKGKGKTEKKASVLLPGFPDMPLFKPKDTDNRIHLVDSRRINPANGLPFPAGKVGGKSISVGPRELAAIVAHAKAKGIDPYDALAVPYQETGFGASGTGLGENKDFMPDNGVGDAFDDLDERNLNIEANAMVKGLADKFRYAKALGYGDKGKAYQFQAYNGYGKIAPKKGEKPTSYYGIPVSHENPLNMAANPVYGKVVSSLRDILASNPDVKRIVDTTPAFKNVWDEQPAVAPPEPVKQKVMLRVKK